MSTGSIPMSSCSTLQLQEDGTALASFRHKIDQPNGNSMLYGDGTLGSVASATAEGTWSITFMDDTNVLLRSPDGTESAIEFPQSSVASFDTSIMGVYLGSQNNQTAYIGRSVTYSNFTLTVGGRGRCETTVSKPVTSSRFSIPMSGSARLPSMPHTSSPMNEQSG